MFMNGARVRKRVGPLKQVTRYYNKYAMVEQVQCDRCYGVPNLHLALVAI